ncbi:hypothetical protein [Streptomyces sp. GMR22]|uniref:hypothetical protein n=1 Tax=Streptomyces sp. GMR22 TaxID=2759524 RepID=UPI001F2A1FB4|nr:hypothetical protein [Streptomyces sp. GMR22]
MSEAAADGHEALIPQPNATAEDLRAAVVQIAPNQVAVFDAERTAAVEAARSQVDAAPMRRFLRRWALAVAIERVPARAARLSELEARAGQVESLAEGRAIAAEVAAIHAKAAAEAGSRRRCAAPTDPGRRIHAGPATPPAAPCRRHIRLPPVRRLVGPFA